MGRDAEASLAFAGKIGAGRILLESNEIILRGEVRARISRRDVTGFSADGDDLTLRTRQGDVVATLGAKEAAAWLKALAKPAPGLAEKLGVRPNALVFVVGQPSDATLLAAIAPFRATEFVGAALVLAELADAAAFEIALEILQFVPALPFWGVTRKGKSATFSDQILRQSMRARGYIDTKSCAVSSDWTATRYHRRS